MKSRILLHQCCAPCSIYPVKRLMEEGFAIEGWFYNPNIHPFQEYQRRLQALELYNQAMNIPYKYESYGLKSFLSKIDDFDNRCGVCYSMRLAATAQKAAAEGFDAFTSSLLYSRRQKHEDILGCAREMAAEYKTEFYYEDYRKGWQVGIDISKEMGIYRQPYCGCIFSEEERYNNAGAKKRP